MEERKYLITGEEVVVTSKIPAGYIVCSVRTEGDGYNEPTEEYIEYENPYTVREVFDTPPVDKKHKEIEKLDKKVQELQNKKNELDRQIRETETTHKEQLEKYKKYSQLLQLDKYLDGKITHYVEEPGWGECRIITWGKETESEYSNSEYGIDKMKLLTLYGKSKGNLEWNLNKYSDGSGGGTTVHPCCSYEEAIEKLTEILNEKIRKQLESGKINEGYIIKAAKKYNIVLPQEYIDAADKQMQERLQNAIKTSKEELAKKEKALEEYNQAKQ